MTARAVPAAARFRAYRGLGGIQFGSAMMYRTEYLFGLVGTLLQVLLLSLVWTAVYDSRGSLPASAGGAGIPLSTQIAYATLASLQYWLLNPWNMYATVDRIRTGTIAIDLARPVPFLQQMLAGKAGSTCAMVPFVLLALPFALLLGGAEPPGSAAAAAGYVVSLVLAYLIATLLLATMELIAFWTLEVGGIFMIYRMVGQFCAGVLVPLWFMPDWLRTIAEFLPFQATTYTPLAIYLGRIEGADMAAALGLQAFWVLVAGGLLRLVWSRAEHRVVVQGG